VQVRLLLGPAGSGKTFRCLAEARAALEAAPEGPPLLLLAPKQTTFELERRLLADPSVGGYTRLHILSFERLAHFIFERLQEPAPAILDEEGRLMVLRSLLAKKRNDLKLFRASARLNGFARQLSLALSELQRHNLAPETLSLLAGQVHETEGLSLKLQDLATLLCEYLDWLKAHDLQDADCLLSAAEDCLETAGGSPESEVLSPEPGVDRLRTPRSALRIQNLWVDGFAEWSPQELELLAALIPHCERATVTFCLDRVPAQKVSWLSNWSAVREAFDKCRKRLESLPAAEVAIELLPRKPEQSRFVNNLALQHLEEFWAEPRAYASNELPIRLAACADPEAEATLAAREILRHVRNGGRYREVSVLVRRLEGYHEPLQRVLSRYEIPYFLDRRESVSHHPLAELTRSALRTVAFQWEGDDWFAALKTGLVPAAEKEIDELETEALARGWKGAAWGVPLRVRNQTGLPTEREQELELRLERLRQVILPPFQKLELALGAQQNRPTGLQLAAALREFWQALNIAERLQEWANGEVKSDDLRMTNSVHATVWEQMHGWLDNIELAFPREALPFKEWLPVIEAGLSSLTVGVIPPALDQVLVGAVDRSRNPDIKLALVLGLNETVFPAPPEAPVLLTEADRAELERRNVSLGSSAQRQLGRERYYAYLACTRARERLVLTYALHDANGSPLNPSPFLSQVQQLFPSLKIEAILKTINWRESEHVSELIVPLLRVQSQETAAGGLEELASVPALSTVLAQLRHFQRPESEELLAPELAVQVYGPVLKTSVSRIEQFAACPFKFFVNSGLRAEERKLFELDVKEQGSFQHDVLAYFHQELHQENKRWRDITPNEARERVARIANALMASYRAGLLQASEQTRFLANVLSESLQDFVETLVEWMRTQYRFDPVEVELPFGDDNFPPWEIALEHNQRLQLRGRIDRVDTCPTNDPDEAWCVVVDYKSSQKQLDPVLMEHGLQLQLPAYLNVLRRWPDPRAQFGVKRLIPAGVFYVNLRGKYGRGLNRNDALANAAAAHKLAYRHTGRFDKAALPLLDARPDAKQGDQFNYRKTKTGEVNKSSREALDSPEFEAMLDSVEASLKQMGEQIFSGAAKVHPFRKGSLTACSFCDYRPICRFDPWTQSYRVLKREESTSDFSRDQG
jgi:ATP-dependent helicase/nuclease subunit B